MYQIIQAVSNGLKPLGVTIYTEQPRVQKLPCFIIETVGVSTQRQLGTGVAPIGSSVQLDIIYVPKVDASLREIYDMSCTLDKIFTDGFKMGSKMLNLSGLNFKIIDNVLHYFITVNVRGYKCVEDATAEANTPKIDVELNYNMVEVKNEED